MQETVHSPHQIDFLVRWLKERIRRDEEAEWGSPCLGGVCLLSGERGVWSYRKETNGECGFSVQSYSPETERDAPLGDLGRAPPFGSLRMYPAPDNSTDVASECNDDQWRPYLGMLLEEMKRPRLAVAVGAEESEEATEQERQPGLADRPSWLPRKPETRRRWQKAYNYMCDLDEEYRDRWHDFGDNPEPKRAHYADYLAQQMSWRPCEKTIGRIKRAGKELWLS